MIGDKVINHTEYQKKCKKMSIEALKYTIQDCKKTIEANPDNPNNGYYQDEISYCGMELRKRREEIKEILSPIINIYW